MDVDKDWFLFLNKLHTGFWDTVMLLITRKEIWIPLLISILYFIFKTCGKKGFMIIFFLIIAILASDQLSVLIKDLVQRLRPVHDPEIQNLVHNILRKGGLYGFPSSHAANSFAILAFTAGVFKNRSYFFLMLVWALLISYSRIYGGVHYPFDVLGGMIFGSLIGIVFYKLAMLVENRLFLTGNPKLAKIRLKGNQSGLIILVFVVLMSTMLIIAWILHKYNYL